MHADDNGLPGYMRKMRTCVRLKYHIFNSEYSDREVIPK